MVVDGCRVGQSVGRLGAAGSSDAGWHERASQKRQIYVYVYTKKNAQVVVVVVRQALEPEPEDLVVQVPQPLQNLCVGLCVSWLVVVVGQYERP